MTRTIEAEMFYGMNELSLLFGEKLTKERELKQ